MTDIWTIDSNVRITSENFVKLGEFCERKHDMTLGQFAKDYGWDIIRNGKTDTYFSMEVSRWDAVEEFIGEIHRFFEPGWTITFKDENSDRMVLRADPDGDLEKEDLESFFLSRKDPDPGELRNILKLVLGTMSREDIVQIVDEVVAGQVHES